MKTDLETQLGPTWPDGVEISFGQWQKLALARGFMQTDPLVLDHLLGERLVPRTAANPVLAAAHDVDAAALAGRRSGRCGRTAGELLGKAPDLEPQLVGRPLLQRLRHRVEGTRRTG